MFFSLPNFVGKQLKDYEALHRQLFWVSSPIFICLLLSICFLLMFLCLTFSFCSFVYLHWWLSFYLVYCFLLFNWSKFSAWIISCVSRNRLSSIAMSYIWYNYNSLKGWLSDLFNRFYNFLEPNSLFIKSLFYEINIIKNILSKY